MCYFVSCKNWLMVQFIGYNVEGGSAYHKGGGGYMDGWHATSLSEENCLLQQAAFIQIFLRFWHLGECTNQFVLPRSGFPCFHRGLDWDGWWKKCWISQPHHTTHLNWRQHRILFSQLFPDPLPQSPTTKPPEPVKNIWTELSSNRNPAAGIFQLGEQLLVAGFSDGWAYFAHIL